MSAVRRGVLLTSYLALTFAITWSLWAAVLHATEHSAPSAVIRALLSLGGPLFLIGVFAPGLVALGLTALESGRAATAALLDRVVRWRVPLRYYAFALLLIPLTKLAVAVAYRGLTGGWPQFGETNPALLLIATAVSTIGQVGEELGWRGYLLPKLSEGIGLVGASLVVGIVWATWHLPLFFARGADTNGQSFPLYAMEVTAISVALSWLYWRTGGSLLLTMILHSAVNNTKDIVPSRSPQEIGPFTFEGTLVLRLTVVFLWIVAAVLLVRMRSAKIDT